MTDQGYGLLKTAVEARTDDIPIRLSSEISDKSAFFLQQPKCDKECKGNYARTQYLPQQHGTTLSRQEVIVVLVVLNLSQVSGLDNFWVAVP